MLFLSITSVIPSFIIEHTHYCLQETCTGTAKSLRNFQYRQATEVKKLMISFSFFIIILKIL